MRPVSDFLYCHNPLDDKMGEFLYHLAEPNCLIKIISLDDENPIEDKSFTSKEYAHTFFDGSVLEYQLVVASYTKNNPHASTIPAEELIQILDNAWAFWVAILDSDDDEDDLNLNLQ